MPFKNNDQTKYSQRGVKIIGYFTDITILVFAVSSIPYLFNPWPAGKVGIQKNNYKKRFSSWKGQVS